MKYGIVRFPGSNCDFDTYHTITKVMGEQAEFLWHLDRINKSYDCIILPGGFSYGDYLRCGAIARFSPVMEDVVDFANKGGLVIGICNGFQVLLEAGLLPGALMKNEVHKFICKYINLVCENDKLSFTRNIKDKKVLNIPIAHFDGNYFADDKLLNELKENNQIVFRYSDINGNITDEANPNGSVYNIAGIVNKAGNVLGMMPHPERAVEKLLGSEDGKLIFDSISA